MQSRQLKTVLTSGATCHIFATDLGYKPFVLSADVGGSHMQDWQTQFENMRASFLSRAGERLDRINGLLETMHQAPTDEGLLAEVRQHFHWLCGVGGTYKLPEVSELGWEGEELCDRLVENRLTPSSADVNRLQGLLGAVRQHFNSVGVA